VRKSYLRGTDFGAMSKSAKERLLTTRQEQIVRLAAQGLTNKAIA
jgi:DNA-binding NarL/FixJ family response regulator